MKTYADPKHWSYKINLIIYILLFCLAECKIYSLLSPGTSLLGWYRWPTCSTWRRCRRSGRSSAVYRIYLCGAVCCALVCRSVCFRLRFYIGLLTKFIGQLFNVVNPPDPVGYGTYFWIRNYLFRIRRNYNSRYTKTLFLIPQDSGQYIIL